jgi:hypothetical protein
MCDTTRAEHQGKSICQVLRVDQNIQIAVPRVDFSNV